GVRRRRGVRDHRSFRCLGPRPCGDGQQRHRNEGEAEGPLHVPEHLELLPGLSSYWPGACFTRPRNSTDACAPRASAPMTVHRTCVYCSAEACFCTGLPSSTTLIVGCAA